jgi:G3E family GTPase
VPETLEYNISSFVFRARRPFHPKRFYDLIEDKERVGSVLRGKGFVWYGGFLNILFPSGANNAKVAGSSPAHPFFWGPHGSFLFDSQS